MLDMRRHTMLFEALVLCIKLPSCRSGTYNSIMTVHRATNHGQQLWQLQSHGLPDDVYHTEGGYFNNACNSTCPAFSGNRSLTGTAGCTGLHH